VFSDAMVPIATPMFVVVAGLIWFQAAPRLGAIRGEPPSSWESTAVFLRVSRSGSCNANISA
jgi:hypothetical protein